MTQLPPARPLTSDLARAWTGRGQPDRRVAWWLTAGTVAAFAVAAALDSSTCSPQDPDVCGPDVVFSLAFTLVLACPVLGHLAPRAGYLAGVTFALLDLRFDPALAPRVAFGLHGAACLIALVAHERRARTARSVLREAGAAAGVAPVGVPASVPPGRPLLRLGLGALALTAALGSTVWWWVGDRAEDRHLARAVTVTAEVLTHVDDYDIQVRPLDGAPEGSRETYVIETLDRGPYPVGSTTLLLLDPRDPGWVRLLAELHDITWRLTIALGALIVAVGVLGGELRRRAALRRLLTRPAYALAVRVRPGAGTAEVLATDDPGPAVAQVHVAFAVDPEAPDAPDAPDAHEPDGDDGDDGDDWDDWDAAAVDEFGRLWRDEVTPAQLTTPDLQHLAHVEEDAQDAVLLTDGVHRGAALLLTERDGVLVPSGPLLLAARPGAGPRPRRLWDRLRDRDGGVTTDADDDLLPGAAVVLDGPLDLPVLPDLPVTSRPPQRTRGLGQAMVAAGGLGVPLGVALLGLTWEALPAAFVGGQFVVGGAARWRSRLVFDRAALQVVGPWRHDTVPWERVHGARVTPDGELHLAFDPDITLTVPAPLDGALPGETPRDVALRWGRWTAVLRQRALAAGAAGRRPEQRPGVAWPLLAAYAVAVAVALLLAG